MKIGNSFFRLISLLIVTLLMVVFPRVNRAAESGAEVDMAEIEKQVEAMRTDAGIPGASLVIVRDGHADYFKGFGFSDLEKKTPVTSKTLYQLASCSKSFTALAVLSLAEEGRIDLDAPISNYFEWFYMNYKGEKSPITVRQLMHHTSGIPWKTMALIPPGKDANALEDAVRLLVGTDLEKAPGEAHIYSNMNYDILGLLIQKVTGKSYEKYMQEDFFASLGLNHTSVEEPKESSAMASGYKLGFFSPRLYDAPAFRGNNPAGYVISNGDDMALWLKMQMGLMDTPRRSAILESQKPDLSVIPPGGQASSYGGGWEIFPYKGGAIYHDGMNPTFTSFVGFNREKKVGLALLVNSNSTFTTPIALYVLKRISGEKVEKVPEYQSEVDSGLSIISIILAIYAFLALLYLPLIIIDIVKGRRHFEGINGVKALKLVLTLAAMVPYLYGLKLLPMAIADFNWNLAVIWGPVSLSALAILVCIAMGVTYLNFLVSSVFPRRNRYLRSLPSLILLSILSGLANTLVILIISSSVSSSIDVWYMVYYFALVFFIYILGSKVVGTELTKISQDIIYDLRMKLFNRIFRTSYMKFEQIKRGRVLATLNDDTQQIGNSAGIAVTLVTSVITTIGAFLYLGTIAGWATLITLVVVAGISTLYYFVSKSAEKYFEAARDTNNVYMNLVTGMLDGFKELSMNRGKKREYTKDVHQNTHDLRTTRSIAQIKFINAFLVGESFLIIILGVVAFSFSRLFTDIQTTTLISFLMVLLYLIGPINAILHSFPMLMMLNVSWKRVQGFIQEIPANLSEEELDAPPALAPTVERLEARGVRFAYHDENGNETFAVGPIDFAVNKGEIMFIIGGNGSGKSTLAHLTTGLYVPEEGEILVNGEKIDQHRLGECFSTVFSDFHLFEKLYDIDLDAKRDAVEHYLEVLDLKKKITVEDDRFSSTNLSGGQKKRLKLLKCYLEERPVYLFDEVAADQDPQFRKFFYRELLPTMREEGKIVIAITHDDHYFDVADRVMKLDVGKMDQLEIESGAKGG